jgi:hypothetical protein
MEVVEWKKQSQGYKLQHCEEDEEQHPTGYVGTPQDIAVAAFLSAPTVQALHMPEPNP